MSLACKTGHSRGGGDVERCLAVVWMCRPEDSVSLPVPSLTSQRGASSLLITALSGPAEVRGDG